LLDVRTRGVRRALAAALAGAACAHADVGADADAGVPVPIVEGIRHVREEVAGVRTLDSSVPWPQVAAESALTYVQSRLSPAVFAAIGGGDDLEAAFARQAGLCGQIVEAFMQILRGAGVDVLPVQFFYVLDGTRMSHVAAQVRWRGRWHYVDPTWGLLFERGGRVLSPEQVLALRHPARYMLMNRLVPWTDANVRRGGGWSPLSYLTAATHRQVVMNGKGTVRPPRSVSGSRATWSLALMPDYVGTYVPYAGKLVGIGMRLEIPAGARTLVIATRGKLCGGLGTLRAGRAAIPFADVPDAGELRVPLAPRTRAVTLRAGGGNADQPCAVLLDGLRAE